MTDMDGRRIYVDYAATTPLDPDVFQAMKPFLIERYGNASTLYRTGREVRRALDEARDTVAHAIGAQSPGEIIFTSGGSESDNLAVKGVAWALADQGRHIVTTAIEHHAVLDTAKWLKQWGFDVTFLTPDRDGVVQAHRVAEAIRDDTILVSVMHANNETGSIQPIREIAQVTKERGVLFHTDAVQTVGHLPVNVEDLGCDLLSFSAHKFYGPKGVGGLYIRRGTPLAPLIHGGGQERERRAGTENVAGIVGLAYALQVSIQSMEQEAQRLRGLRDALAESLLTEIPLTRLNGHPTDRLPGHVNVTFSGTEGESILLNLDMKGIEASSGSACTSGSIEASHVLLAMGLSRAEALGSVRFTLGKYTTEDDIRRIAQVLPPIIQRLRSL